MKNSPKGLVFEWKFLSLDTFLPCHLFRFGARLHWLHLHRAPNLVVFGALGLGKVSTHKLLSSFFLWLVFRIL